VQFSQASMRLLVRHGLKIYGVHLGWNVLEQLLPLVFANATGITAKSDIVE
jgi:hypothetical protein